MKNRKRRAHLMLLATAIAFACAPLFAPVSPTLDPDSINTVIAGTAAAAATQTALLTPPTWTAIPTLFPTATIPATPTVTETFIFLIFSPTPTLTITPSEEPTQNYACKVIAQTPPNGTVFNRKAAFTTRWSVTNTGFQAWDANNSDYVFVSGADLHKKGGYDLNFTVEPGQSIDLVVDMAAPNQKGTYSTVWEIRVGTVRFCRMRLTIEVQ